MFTKLNRLIILCTVMICFSNIEYGHSKIVQGQLRTLQDWAFLSRFCFISGKGRFEYWIEFERRYGEPQMLLYYDDITQWPAVYKTKTTCQQKMAVLSAGDNQIVMLSVRPPYNFISGCKLQPKNSNSKPPLAISTQSPSLDSTYFDQFLSTSTEEPFAMNASDYNQTEFFNTTSDLENDEIDIFNVSSNFYSGTPISRDTSSLENRLENGTDFLNDVEELFAFNNNISNAVVKGTVRLRRSLPRPLNFKREGHGTYVVSCNNIGGFTSSRERWWYIAIANCGSGLGLNVSFRFRLTNGPPGDFWHEHFSADEMYILPIFLSESLLYSFLVFAVFVCAVKLKTLHLLHTTYRMFELSVILQWIGTMVQTIVYTMYAMSGHSPHTTTGELILGGSEVVFLALMLLMAKGYTITRARLSSRSMIRLATFLNVYIIAFMSLFIFQTVYFDPGEVMNLYESPAGSGLAALRIGAWVAFTISSVNTLKKNPEKASFYFPFALLGSLWIMGGPITTLFGVYVLDAWVRESVICFVRAAVAFCGHSAFLYLTWPSRANKSFPYHVRTNHVGIASEDDDGADYPRHTYEPSLADQNTIIPLSRRTEELLNGVYGQYLNDHLGYAVQPTASAPDLSNLQTPTISTTHQNRTSQSVRNDAHNEDVDSGHPSLETSPTNSPNNNTPLASTEDTPNMQRRLHHQPPIDSSQNFNGSSKPNPFIVNGIKRAPNKIILEPIDHPAVVNEMSRGSSGGAVPRHLFAAKNPPITDDN